MKLQAASPISRGLELSSGSLLANREARSNCRPLSSVFVFWASLRRPQSSPDTPTESHNEAPTGNRRQPTATRPFGSARLGSSLANTKPDDNCWTHSNSPSAPLQLHAYASDVQLELSATRSAAKIARCRY